MVLKVYAIQDVKAGHYATPFFMASNGLAIRAFSDLVKDQQSTLSRHPDDFKLFLIGEYDDNSGELISTKPEFLANASEFIYVAKSNANGGV